MHFTPAADTYVGMLRMIVCDWNGTLFRDPLEERFFFGLCRLAFYKAVRSGSLRNISSLIMRGLWWVSRQLSHWYFHCVAM